MDSSEKSPGDISSLRPVIARSADGTPQKCPAMRGKNRNSTRASGTAFSSMAPVVRNGRSGGPSPAARDTFSSEAASSQAAGTTMAAVTRSCA